MDLSSLFSSATSGQSPSMPQWLMAQLFGGVGGAPGAAPAQPQSPNGSPAPPAAQPGSPALPVDHLGVAGGAAYPNASQIPHPNAPPGGTPPVPPGQAQLQQQQNLGLTNGNNSAAMLGMLDPNLKMPLMMGGNTSPLMQKGMKGLSSLMGLPFTL